MFWKGPRTISASIFSKELQVKYRRSKESMIIMYIQYLLKVKEQPLAHGHYPKIQPGSFEHPSAHL